MRAQKLTTDLAVAAMLLGMAGLVVNIFGVWHYIFAVSVAGAERTKDAEILGIYVFMNIPLKVSLVVCSIALLYRVRWGRWGMTIVGAVSIVHSIVATAMLPMGIVHYWLQIAAPEGGPHPLVKGWDYVVVVIVVLFYGFMLWHLHRRSTRDEFRLAASEPIDWTPADRGS